MADGNAAQSDWQALMGQDLLLKIVHRTSNPSRSEDSAADGGVQPQDAVVVDFVGRCLLETRSNASTGEDEASETMEGKETDPESSGLNGSMEEGEIFHEVKGWLLVVGEKDVVPALEMGIRFMRVGETALVRSHSKYAYGPGQRNWKSKGIDRAFTLPANSTVQYTVTLQRIVPTLEVETRRFQLQLCDAKKQIGNDIYNNDHLSPDNLYAKSRALQVYQRAADILIHMLQQQATEGERDTGKDDDDMLDTTAARDCLLACLNNIAAVHLKCQSYHAAKEACVTVLERDPSNVKALMRAAQAALLDPASSYEEVDAAIQAASSATKKAASEQHSSAVPTSESSGKLGGELERLRRDLQRKQRAHAKKERAMWFAKMARSTLESADETVNRLSLPPPTLAGDQLDVVDKDLFAPDQDVASIPTGNGPSSDQDDPVPKDDTTLDATNGSFWQSLPWKRVILPYGLQLIAPFVMYYFFLQMRQQSIDRESGHGNSSGNNGDMRAEL